MHFNTGKLLSISTLFLPILASTNQDASTKVPDKFDPYAEENLEWHEFDLASLFNETEVEINQMDARDWSPWEELDSFRKKYFARRSCIASGIEIERTVATAFVPLVCPTLLRQVPGFKALDGGWDAFQTWYQHDADGDRTKINYRNRTSGDNPPKLTESLCDKGYDMLTNILCYNDEGKTQGATISIKRKDDDNEENELQIGFDPNDQNIEHESTHLDYMDSCKVN